MKFSLESDYAVRIVLNIYMSEQKRKKSTDIINECFIPPKVGQRIITKLVKSGILISNRGLNGGIEAIKDSKDLTLYDVISSVEDLTIKKCIDDPSNCQWKCGNCSVYRVMLEIKQNFLRDLQNVNFCKLVENM